MQSKKFKTSGFEELKRISQHKDAPTLRQLGDRYIEAMVRRSHSVSEAARRLGMSYKGLRLRVFRDDSPPELMDAVSEKLNRNGDQ